MAQIELIGAPIDCGKRRQGCLMGPDAYRVAGMRAALENLGHQVRDLGNLVSAPDAEDHDVEGVYALREVIGWTRTLAEAAEASVERSLPIFMGGDHAMSLGTITGVARAAARAGRPQFVLWIDAHSDFHNLHSTESGNLHGTPLAYATGGAGFEGFPVVDAPIPHDNLCLFGLRSVDGPEKAVLQGSRANVHDMRDIDENGVIAPMRKFLARVAEAGGALHVSLDVDFLTPEVAPAVGTTVPGGATVREAHLVMELISESGLVTSLDLAELNPFLDERGRTASLMVDLAASVMGRRVFDRPTVAFSSGD